MISLFEVAERARSGSKMSGKAWGLILFHTLQALIQRHNLQQEARAI